MGVFSQPCPQTFFNENTHIMESYILFTVVVKDKCSVVRGEFRNWADASRAILACVTQGYEVSVRRNKVYRGGVQ